MKITDLILQQYAPAARNIWLDTLTETEPDVKIGRAHV